ncbi:hypothetical protein WMY93_016554 [Mugilogobius chulae]|uniref:D-aminoacyl-tRNA deacylase n=1 Tax=Mugilogobius chulae TaxID=88201 RepID=A0AAW0NWP1_9GOBI
MTSDHSRQELVYKALLKNSHMSRTKLALQHLSLQKEKSEIQMVNPNTMTYQHEEQRVEVSHTEEIQDSDTTQQQVRRRKYSDTTQQQVRRRKYSEHTTTGQEKEYSDTTNNRSGEENTLTQHNSRRAHSGPHTAVGGPLKRKSFPDEEIPKRKLQSLETDLVQSSKHVSTTESPKEQLEQRDKSERPLEARVVVQQCSSAKVKPEPEWTERSRSTHRSIGEGLVVYVCFFEGATDETTQRIVSCLFFSFAILTPPLLSSLHPFPFSFCLCLFSLSLSLSSLSPSSLPLSADSVMNTRFFRASFRRQLLSVLDLPGAVLLVPQESLGYEPGPRRSMQSRGVSEAWLGKRLFSSLVQHCSELLRAKGTEGAPWSMGCTGRGRR